jgi:uncharacterized pyridoxamine 5'-phosphate oxidase family protein
MEPEKYRQLFNEVSEHVLDQLASLKIDDKNGITAYMQFILASVSADGNLSEGEFELLKPIFDAMAEKDVSYEEGRELFNMIGLNKPDAYQNIVNTMVDIIGIAKEDLKDEIILLCLLVCAIDGKVSEKEKAWIRQLAEPMKITVTPMEYLNSILDKAGVFTLATTDGDQPRMRVLGLKIVLDQKIYFAVGTFKDVYKQLQKNPKCEILASVGMEFIRWDGNATFSDDPRLMPIVENMMPDLAKLYKQMGWELGFFTLEGGSAEYVNVSNEKKKIF